MNSPAIKEFAIRGQWMGERRTVPLCLVQPDPPPKTPWPWPDFQSTNRRLAERLLRPGDGASPLIDGVYAPTAPVVIVFPELAFSFDHWPDIDGFVSSRQGPTILIGGFGFVGGNQLTEWAAGDPGHRFWVWNEGELMTRRVYNAAFAWVHVDGQTDCYCLLKQYPQEVGEAEIPGWAAGPRPLVLVAGTLRLYPLICFDLLTSGAGTPAEKLIGDMGRHPGQSALILGMMLQHEPTHDVWHRRLRELLPRLGVTQIYLKVAVALCHYGEDSPYADAGLDQWRCMTGVYRHSLDAQYLSEDKANILKWSLSAGRSLQVSPINGMVVRYGHGCIAGGDLIFEYNQDGYRYLWKPTIALDSSGNPPLPPAAYEILRLLRRFPKVDGFPGNHLIGAALRTAETVVLENAELLCSGFAIGQDIGRPMVMHHDDLDEFATDWASCFQALALIRHFGGGAEIQRSEYGHCDLSWPRQDGVVRLWCAKKLSRFLIHDAIDEWCRTPGDHPPILLVTRGDGAQKPDNKLYSSRTARTADRPVSQSQRDACRTSGGRKVHCLPWAELSDAMIDQDRARARSALDAALSPHFEIEETAA